MDIKKTTEAVRKSLVEAGVETKFRLAEAADGRTFMLLEGWQPNDKFPAVRRVGAAHKLIVDGTDGVIWEHANRAPDKKKR